MKNERKRHLALAEFVQLITVRCLEVILFPIFFLLNCVLLLLDVSASGHAIDKIPGTYLFALLETPQLHSPSKLGK